MEGILEWVSQHKETNQSIVYYAAGQNYISKTKFIKLKVKENVRKKLIENHYYNYYNFDYMKLVTE